MAVITLVTLNISTFLLWTIAGRYIVIVAIKSLSKDKTGLNEDLMSYIVALTASWTNDIGALETNYDTYS